MEIPTAGPKRAMVLDGELDVASASWPTRSRRQAARSQTGSASRPRTTSGTAWSCCAHAGDRLPVNVAMDAALERVVCVGRGEIDSMTAKRVCDVVTAAALLIVTAPVFAEVALAQRIEGTPVLWRSPRVGHRGQLFDLLTFRTMRDLPVNGIDARLTRVGRVLRNYSLDHLPMLINVLRGDMSLVGPRPTEPDRVDLDDPDWQRVLSVRPGVISYAILRLAGTYNSTSAGQRLRLEATYVDRASLAFDLRLLLWAGCALLRSRGNIKARGRPAG